MGHTEGNNSDILTFRVISLEDIFSYQGSIYCASVNYKHKYNIYSEADRTLYIYIYIYIKHVPIYDIHARTSIHVIHACRLNSTHTVQCSCKLAKPVISVWILSKICLYYF